MHARWIPGQHQRFLVFGMGVTGLAVARALLHRGHEVVAADDAPTADRVAQAKAMGIEISVATGEEELAALCAGCDAAVPAPGLPERHPVFAVLAATGTPVISEFDLAAWWDRRPWVSVTGTNGKTTVTTMITEMLDESGIPAVAVGNTEVPLVTAIDDPSIAVFVVEASSFRLAATQEFRPLVAVWLNFAEDHLDVHASLGRYEAAKARSFTDLDESSVAVLNLDDPVVSGHWGRGAARYLGFTISAEAPSFPAHHCAGGFLRTESGEPLVAIAELPRALPIDCANSLAASAAALAAGATPDAVGTVLRRFRGLPHRVSLVGEAAGVRWYDDSKATAPHAVAAALSGFDSVVLIAGGRNKGLDLAVLTESADRVRAVVGIGEAGPEICAAFQDTRPTVPVGTADTMADAVRLAAGFAHAGDVVLLSPGCASFDWYRNYGERGDHFATLVRELVGVG